MRKELLNESPVGAKGRTKYEDATKYINSVDTNKEAQKLINEIKAVAKKLGGYTTVISILQALENQKKL